MNVLVLGSGGREHSICLHLRKSKKLKNLWCIPGNAGTKKIAKHIELNLTNHQEVINFCKKSKIDIVVPGSEEYLEKGISDNLRLSGVMVFGPSQASAKLETSKLFTKKICDKANINSAKWKLFDNYENALLSLNKVKFPKVIKLDGLAAGKGVIVAKDFEEAKKFLNNVKNGNIGNKKSKVIIEEKLIGEEASFFFIVDGKDAKFMGSAKDYKRVGDKNTGLNTGGMGCISPSPLENKKNINLVLKKIINPTLNAMNEIGYTFKGVLYAGLMFTKKGIFLIEYNVRLGDPECQSILSRLESDLIQIITMTEKQKLSTLNIKLSKKKSICIVLASKGYPKKYKVGYKIKGNFEQKNLPVNIVHAGTTLDLNKNLVTNGGRVLNVIANSKEIENAKELAYSFIKKIQCSALFYRKDIGE